MISYRKIILCSFTLHLLFSQIIDHQPENNIYSNIPLNIEMFTDYESYMINSASIYYKLNNQNIYMKDNLNKISDNYYGYVIPGDFIDGKYINYYFLLELNDGSYVSYPDQNPHNFPISIRIDSMIQKNEEDEQLSYLDAIYQIIYPNENQRVINEDLVISLSYFGMENLSLEDIRFFLDDRDLTLYTKIRENNLVFIPRNLSNGEHTVKVILVNKEGIKYNPIIWSFNIVEDVDNKDIIFNGKVWNDYNDNQVDNTSSETNTTNLTFNFDSDWANINGKFKKSSLENEFSQPKDRFSIDINLNDLFFINLGDFYPNLNEFVISGNRVRGIGIKFKSNLFKLDFISGEVAKSIQGRSDESVVITDYYSIYNEESLSDEYFIDISRASYNFARELNGLRLAFSNKNRLSIGINLLKVKDDIGSVNMNFPNSIISLPYDLEIFNTFNSDQFIDFDNNGIYTDGEPVYSIDYNSNGIYDSESTLTIDTQYFLSDPELIKLESSILIEDCSAYNTSECIDGNIYTLIRYAWEIEISYENLDYLEQLYNIDDVIYLSNQWSGDKPKDNVVIGTDFSLTNKKNNLRVKSSFAISLYNENIWDGGITNSQIDALDGYEDCFIGRTYEQAGLDLLIEGSYWENCQAYSSSGDLIELSDYIDVFGTSLNDFPDLEDYSDFFMFTVDNIPLPSVVDKIKNGESIKLNDIFNSPDVAYEIDFSLKVLKQHMNFGLKQIGESFYTLGNPYMQKDVREEYINNSIRLLDNRLFLIMKWNKITNGLLLDNQSISNKYNMNVSYYPGIELPSFNLSFGKDLRESGNDSQGYNSFNWILADPQLVGDIDTCEDSSGEIIDGIDNEADCVQIEGEYDNRKETITDSYNFSINHKFNFIYDHNISLSFFNSLKKDELYYELGFINGIEDMDYVSPKSKSNNFGINLRTQYNYNWESNFQFSRSYFDYAQEASPYYQVQRVSTFSPGFSYSTDYLLEKIGGGINYSKGTGSNEYVQFGIKLYATLQFRNNINMNINYNFKNKDIKNDDNYNNSLFKINLSYKF